MDYVRKTYRICDMHFSDDAKFESHHNRNCLKVDCVPSQYLPRLDESIQGTEEVNNLPATSTQGLDSVEGSAKLIILLASPIPGPSNLEVPAEKIKISKRKNLTKGHLLRQINVTRKRVLSTRSRALYEIASKLRKTNKRLQMQCAKNKARLQAAIDFAESGAI
ncbi:hypothetical protein QE152_g12479 [Popillia japonica]|uniref:THAP-type domain-containing protein n=1 Tax=Popillia japonica TaxID=7064 RepID=A0AAW1LR12_POPJA